MTHRKFDPVAFCALLLAIAATYLGFIQEGNQRFPSMSIYGLATGLISMLLYWLFFCLQKTASPSFAAPNESFVKAVLIVFLLAGMGITWRTRPEYLGWLLACNSLLLTVMLFRKSASIIAFALVLLAGTGMRVIANHSVAFGTTSDMLPLARSGLKFFLEGENPYRDHIIQMPSQTYPLPLTYLPLTWLAYLPAYLLDVDLRWTNVAANILSAILLWLSFGKSRHDSHAPALLTGIWFLNPYFAYRMDTEISIFCMTLSLFLYAMSCNRFWILGVTTGLMLACNQLALIITPFAFLYMVARAGLRQSAFVAILAMAIFSILIAPFYGEAMLHGIIGYWHGLLAADYPWARNWILNFNFTVFFYWAKAQWMLVPAQIALCLFMFAAFISTRSYDSIVRTLNFSAATLMLFLQFNLVVWTFLFFPVFILWSWSIAQAQKCTSMHVATSKAAEKLAAP